MEIIVLNDQLFKQSKLQKNQIIHNKNGDRPYYYSFKRNNHRICVPFRTNASKVPNKYKEKLGHVQPDKPHSAIDLTKIIILTNSEYLNNKQKANIPPKIHKYLKRPERADNIERKFDIMIKDFIQAKSLGSKIPLVRFSTLQYFTKELDIQKIIDRYKG